MNSFTETNPVSIVVPMCCGFLRRILTFALAALLCGVWPTIGFCTDGDFVGVLSLAVQDDVAAKLQLSAEQKSQLHSMIDDCESKAVDLVMQWKDLPAADRGQKLAAFRRESEAKGLALLTPEQQKRLEQIRLGRLGLASLAEPAVAERLALSEEQKKQIAELLEKRNEDLAKADEKTARVIQTESERNLAAILTEKQKADWDSLTSVQSAPEVVSTTVSEAQPAAQSQAKPQETAADKSTATAEKKASTSVGTAASAAAPRAEPPKHPDKIRFKFRYHPWKDVLPWFAEQADLSLVMDSPPSGTFNYSDDREFSPTEAIDLLNSVLLTKGYTLVRRDRMLMLVNLEDGVPANLVPNVTLDSLDKRGESELVSVIFNLEKLSPEEAAGEIEKLKGPQTTVVALPKSRQLVITDTVARLRVIRGVIQRVEDPQGIISGQVRTFTLRYYTPEEILPILRQMLEIPEDKNTTADGSLRIAIDAPGKRLLATGRSEKLARLEEVLKQIDAPKSGSGTSDLEGAPQVEVYTVNTADPQSTLKVMQTLLAGLPDVRMDIDPKTNNLIVLARPAQHATIKATLDQMQQDARRVEVIRLRMLDPQLAVLSINKLFGAGGDASKNATAPQVDADPGTRQLLIRGTASQIEQIRSMLQKMGETDNKEMVAASAGNVRMLPLSSRSARSALERIQEIWPSVRQNKLRVVTPSASIPTLRPSDESESPAIPQPLLDRLRRPPADSPQEEEEMPPRPPMQHEEMSLPAEPPLEDNFPEIPSPPDDRTTGGRQMTQFRLVANETQVQRQATDTKELPANTLPKKKAPPAAVSSDKKEPAPIIVAPGPGGIMIASEDVEALDEFEKMLTSMIGGSSGIRPELTIIYLKHAKAAVVTDTLLTIFGGTPSGGNSSGGATLLGNLAGAALGDAGGGIMGTLLGGSGGGTIQPTGSLKITPDPRLNALVVQANETDLDTIEQLLKVLDQKESPEDIQVTPRAKMIQLYNTDASTVAEIVKEVYRDRMVLSSSQTQGMPGPMGGPQAFFQQMMGGGRQGRGGAGGRQQTDELPKMSVGVDTRNNALIVAAPESLFDDVKRLVETLDTEYADPNDTVRVVTLHRSSSQTVEQALSALGGESLQFTRTTGSSGSTNQPQFGQGRGGSSQNAQRSNRGPGNTQQGRSNQQFGQRGGGFQGGGFQSGGFQGGGFQGGGGNFQRGGGNFQGGGGNFQRGGGNFQRGGGN